MSAFSRTLRREAALPSRVDVLLYLVDPCAVTVAVDVGQLHLYPGARLGHREPAVDRRREAAKGVTLQYLQCTPSRLASSFPSHNNLLYR